MQNDDNAESVKGCSESTDKYFSYYESGEEIVAMEMVCIPAALIHRLDSAVTSAADHHNYWCDYEDEQEQWDEYSFIYAWLEAE